MKFLLLLIIILLPLIIGMSSLAEYHFLNFKNDLGNTSTDYSELYPTFTHFFTQLNFGETPTSNLSENSQNYNPDYSALRDDPSLSTRVKREFFTDPRKELNLTPEEFESLRAGYSRRHLSGYDCSRPTSIRSTSSFFSDPCNLPNIQNSTENFKVDKASKYQILQKAHQREYSAWKCQKFLSQIAFYCGNYHHSTPLPQETFFRRPQYVPLEECFSIRDERSFVSGDGKRHHIAINNRKIVEYYKHGSVVPYSGDLGTELTCSGSKLRIQGEDIYSMVIHITEEVIFKREKIIRREDTSLIAFYDNIRINAGIEELGNVQGDTTYIWKIPIDKYCPIFDVKKFEGQITTYTSEESKTKVLMSTDNGRVRFILKGQLTLCDQQVYVTNYKDLYVRDILADGIEAPNIIAKRLPPSEVKLHQFITNRDDFVYHHLSSRLRVEFEQILLDDCHKRFQEAKNEHFLDRKMPDFYTYRLGGPNFMTVAGESAYLYTCESILVTAITADRCYDALPISIADKSILHTYTQNDGESVTSPKYFLEPVTHRITKVAKELPCLNGFHAKYRDVFNEWFSVTPRIVKSEPPEIMTLDDLGKPRVTSYSPTEDFSQGGIYSPDQVDELVRYLENGRLQDAVVHQIAGQVGNLKPGEYITPKQLFPSYAIPGGSWHTFILGKIWGTFRSLGEIFSAFMGTFLVGRFLWFLLKILMNCYFLKGHIGCSKSLFWSLCTDVYYSKRLRKNKKSEKQNDSLKTSPEVLETDNCLSSYRRLDSPIRREPPPNPVELRQFQFTGPLEAPKYQPYPSLPARENSTIDTQPSSPPAEPENVSLPPYSQALNRTQVTIACPRAVSPTLSQMV